MVNDEWFDGRDKDGHLMGIDLKRGEMIPNHVYHIVVEVYIVNQNNEVLTTKRADEKPLGGLWEVTAGSVLKGECEIDAAIRETKEETGLVAQEDEIRPIYTHVNHPAIIKGYALKKTFAREDVVLQPGETIDFKLVPLAQWPDFMASAEFAKPIYTRFKQYESCIMDALQGPDWKTKEKLARSLTANDIRLIRHLPFLLQDLDELGASPQDIELLIRRHVFRQKPLNILELACGKGVVAMHLARTFGAKVEAYDLMQSFVDEAIKKAKQEQLSHLVFFSQGDVNRLVLEKTGFDVVVFAAAGDILGTPEETLQKLSDTIRSKGYLIIDDAFAIKETEGPYLCKQQWTNLFEANGLELIEALEVTNSQLEALNSEQQPQIEKRAHMLKNRFPEDSILFDNYVKAQQDEWGLLEHDVKGVTMLIRKKD
jgi:8-oxo-dGTP pyrophosphatase MutT (NUDIX family)/tRNA A58 N-methylase Trm61